MENIVLIVHVIAAFAVIGLVLIQHGKGADVGASFGSGASQTLFGSSGSGNFLSRVTAILVTVFFVTCLSLGIMTSKRYQTGSIDELLKKVTPSAEKKESPATGSAAAQKTNSQDNDIPNLPSQ